MGKDSKLIRLKKGVQPSSSHRSAELLEKSSAAGGGGMSFMSAAAEAQLEFGVLKPQTMLTTILIDDDLPPEIRMTFRKLQKKDAITKIKALAELAQQLGAPVSSKDNSPASSREGSVERPQFNPNELEELSKVLLPHWTKAYQKLALDDSRKVREQAQFTLTQICKNVGRHLAPYLKQLMPSWYLAQHDLYSPVASAAKRSFQTIFSSESKQTEVIRFCKTEIIRSIVDHLQTLFGAGSKSQPNAGDQSGKKNKQGKGKKGAAAAPESEASSSSEQGVAEAGDVPAPTASFTAEGPVKLDGESFALRVACAGLLSLKCLLEQNLADCDTLEEIFGSQGFFWSSCDLTKELLVRRGMFDLLSTLANNLGNQLQEQPTSSSSENQPPFCIPADKCTKFINTALSTNQKETLPNLWNTFLTLTLNGVLSDIQLARKQLLTCCKNGFYGNASQIGPSVLPLLARIWDGLQGDESAKLEFSHDIIGATIIGYGIERSLFEKSAIARTLVETGGYLCKHKSVTMEPIYQFIFSNISDLPSDFATLFGNLIKHKDYYDGLLEYGSENNLLNTRNFGNLVAGICSSSTADTNRPGSSSFVGGFRKRVKFQEHRRESESESSPPKIASISFDSLPAQKQEFLLLVVQCCAANHAYQPLSVLSRIFQDEKIWSAGINVVEMDIAQEEDKVTRLQLYLDLINVHPEIPSLLVKFSNEFDHFYQDPSDLKIFLKEVDVFINLQPIKRWVRMAVFTDVIDKMLQHEKLSEAELQTILKFVLRDVFPAEYVTKVLTIVTERMEKDATFFDNISHILACCSFKVDLSEVYKYYWNMYFLKSVSLEEAADLELIETVCFVNLNKLDPSEVAEILEKYLESCEKLKQIDILIEITKRLGFSGEMLQNPPPVKVKQDVLSFIGQSYYNNINGGDKSPSPDSLIDQQVPKFSKVHRAAISKAIYKAKLIQDSDTLSDLINPLINVIYSQSVAKVWSEIEKSGYFDKLNQELSNELDTVSSRLTEKIYEDKSTWKQLWDEVNNLSSAGDASPRSSGNFGGGGNSSADPMWQSRLPLRILIEYCTKAELTPGLKKTKVPTEDFKEQVDQVLNEFSQNTFKVKDVIPWITEKRIKQPDDFEFDPIFRHIKNKSFVNNLLLITIELMDRVEKDDEITEEFLSLGACWIAAWLKQTKNLNVNSKTQLLWVCNLARGVNIISQKARNLDQLCPKFVQEYVEFHASQIYPIVYALYLQLNEDVPVHSFWTLQTLYYISSALVTMPSNTLAFIEPDSVKLCDIFGKFVGDGISLPSRVAAYKILRKVCYDKSGEGEFPIVPPMIGSMIKTLFDKLNQQHQDSTESTDHNETLMSYLLIWDALLKIQQGSNEFATYVRDQEYLLTPFLNTLFFSEAISLENANGKHFDKEVEISPGSNVNLLHLACTVVQRALRNLPYTVRWWWNNQVTRQRDRVFVEKFIVKYLSSKLAAEELGSVKLRAGVDDNVTIHCHSGCNELIAHYRIEETNVTLTVSLPLNHPLGPVTVKISDKKLHGKISHLLNTRSHSLCAGLKLWKENLDDLYKDVDECAICFFILHNINKQIPKLACHVCKKKFHAACLYKWFSTSNKSECPLCRNLF